MTIDRGYFTRKQVMILETLLKGAENGDFLDIEQLLEKLPYETTRPAMHCSLRHLLKRGMVEKKPKELRDERMKVPWALTPEALKSFDTTTGQFDVVEEGFEDDFPDLNNL